MIIVWWQVRACTMINFSSFSWRFSDYSWTNNKVAESYHIILIIRHCFVEYSMISSIVINIIKMILKRHNHFHSQYNYFFFFCREPHYLCGEYAIVKYIFSITEKSLKSSEGQYNQHCKSIPRLQNLKSKFCLKVSWNKRKLIRLKLSI